VNPLNIVGQRRLPYIPIHFEIIKISSIQEVEKIDQWIYFNLNSRYCVSIVHGLDEKRKTVDVCEIGLEDPRELTMFSLACPYLNKRD